MGFLFVVLACTLWALDTLIRYPLLGSGYSPALVVFTEHLILFLVFTPILPKLLKKLWRGSVRELFFFFVIGAMGSALATLAFTKAFSLINPSLVILLQKFQPLVAIFFARIILGEPIKKQYILWAILCLLGAFLLSFQDFMDINTQDISFSEQALYGYGLTLLAVFSWGLSTVFGKALEKNFSVSEIMAGRFSFGFIVLIPMAISGPISLPGFSEFWIKIILMVSLSGLLGMYFYYLGLRKLSARLCTLAELFFPFCAVTLNWLILDQSLDTFQISGAALLLLGSTIIRIKQY